MPASRTRFDLIRAICLVPLASVLGALLLVFPRVLYLTGDDFGYAENLLRTHWAGHYIPSDWLAPTNFTLAWLGSGLLHLTGRFWLATLGLNLFAGVALAIVTVAALRALGVERGRALLGGALLLAHPFVFAVLITYTGYPLYLFLGVSVVWACATGRALLATVLSMAATLTRQSGIVLFVLVLASHLPAPREWTWRRLLSDRWVALAVLGAAVTIGFVARIPRGWAGKGYGTASAVFSELATGGLVGRVGIILVCWGQATALGQFLSRRDRLRFSRTNLAIGGSIALVLASLSLGHLAKLEPLDHLIWPRKVSILWHLSLGCFLCIDYRRLKYTPFALWGLAVGAILLVRGVIWDFYTIDAFIAFMFSAVTANRTHPVTEPAPPSGFSLGALAIAGAAMMLTAADGYSGLLVQRGSEAQTVLLETAQRAKQIRVTDSAMAFGMAGWKLLDKYVASEDQHKERNCLSCFLGYIADATSVILPDGQYRAALASGEIDSDVASKTAGHLIPERFHLVRLKHPPRAFDPIPDRLELTEPNPTFRRQPVTNSEWDSLARRGSYEVD